MLRLSKIKNTIICRTKGNLPPIPFSNTNASKLIAGRFYKCSKFKSGTPQNTYIDPLEKSSYELANEKYDQQVSYTNSPAFQQIDGQTWLTQDSTGKGNHVCVIERTPLEPNKALVHGYLSSHAPLSSIRGTLSNILFNGLPGTQSYIPFKRPVYADIQTMGHVIEAQTYIELPNIKKKH